MADRPETIKEWATSPTAEIEEPTENFKKQGFGIAQPSVRFFNWILNNIYKWIDYFDQGINSEGGFNHAHQTSRNRIQLPFSFRRGNKLSQIEVFRKGTDSLSDVGNSNSGSSAITTGSEQAGSLTYVGGNTAAVTGASYNGVYVFGGSALDSRFYIKGLTSNGVSAIFTLSETNFVSGDLKTSGGFFKNPTTSAGFFLTNISFSLVTGSLFRLTFLFFDADGDSVGTESPYGSYGFDDLIADNDIFLIGYNSRIGTITGKAIVWRIDSSNSRINWQAPRKPGGYLDFTQAPPEFTNIDLSTVDAFLVAKSYSARKMGFAGSSAGTTTIAGAAWNLKSYSYDADTRKVKIEITPTQTNKALFHTFKIRQGGSDMLSLNSSDAEFASGIWSWSVPAVPITATGIYEFVFQTGGSNLAVNTYTKVTAGLSIETYNEVDYLHISSGVANNTQLFIRKT